MSELTDRIAAEWEQMERECPWRTEFPNAPGCGHIHCEFAHDLRVRAAAVEQGDCLRVVDVIDELVELAAASGDNPFLIQDEDGAEYVLKQLTNETGDITMVIDLAPHHKQYVEGDNPPCKICLQQGCQGGCL